MRCGSCSSCESAVWGIRPRVLPWWRVSGTAGKEDALCASACVCWGSAQDLCAEMTQEWSRLLMSKSCAKPVRRVSRNNQSLYSEPLGTLGWELCLSARQIIRLGVDSQMTLIHKWLFMIPLFYYFVCVKWKLGSGLNHAEPVLIACYLSQVPVTCFLAIWGNAMLHIPVWMTDYLQTHALGHAVPRGVFDSSVSMATRGVGGVCDKKELLSLSLGCFSCHASCTAE